MSRIEILLFVDNVKLGRQNSRQYEIFQNNTLKKWPEAAVEKKEIVLF